MPTLRLFVASQIYKHTLPLNGSSYLLPVTLVFPYAHESVYNSLFFSALSCPGQRTVIQQPTHRPCVCNMFTSLIHFFLTSLHAVQHSLIFLMSLDGISFRSSSVHSFSSQVATTARQQYSFIRSLLFINWNSFIHTAAFPTAPRHRRTVSQYHLRRKKIP